MENKTIHLQSIDDEQWILAHENETVLHALQEHGIDIRQACRNGACGICLTPLLSGEIDYGSQQPRGLNQTELEQGYFLPCIARCKTNIQIGEPKVKRR